MKIDGIEVKVGERIMLDRQEALMLFGVPWWKRLLLWRKKKRPTQNGIYVVTVGTWVRDATDD